MKDQFVILLLLLLSCKSTPEEATKESWKTSNYINSVQILLTNEYQLGESTTSGASSFLILTKEDTLLCTAKHLLGEDMGISPEVKTDEFNSKLVYWDAFPRTEELASDIITVTKMVTEEINKRDIILLDCELAKPNSIQPLTPRFTKAKRGERFEVIGCEYADESCFQNSYFGTMDGYESGQIVLKSEVKFDASGFSGAPVIDENGYVIGVLSGGGLFRGNQYLGVEPVKSIEGYFQ